jgi:imidazolonepropionase-like amidohydrolase
MRLTFIFILCSFLMRSQPILLKNVNIIPVNHDIVIPGCNVFIRDGIIEKITPYPYVKEPGKRAKKKESTLGYITYDCNGGYLIPGLADMHGHLPDAESPIKMQEYLRLCLAAGVTEVRSMRGEKKQLPIRDSVNKKQKNNSPELFISYPVTFEQEKPVTNEQIEKEVKAAKDGGYDFVKYLFGGTEENFNYLAETCRKNNIPLAGHAFKDDLSKTIKVPYNSIEHISSFYKQYIKDSLGFKNSLDSMKGKKMFVCPTLSYFYLVMDQFTEQERQNRNGMNLISEKIKQAWTKEYTKNLTELKGNLGADFAPSAAKWKEQMAKNLTLLKKMYDSGVAILLSADEAEFNVPGFSMYEEMLLYKKAGLTNHQILKCATLNAAECLKENFWGSVQVGKKANLVVLRANPLEKIENIKEVDAVILHGKYWKPEELTK